MLFNSGTFLLFFAAFVLLYYSVRRHLTARNVLIVCASYLFYGWWDYRFLSLLFLSSLLDYTVGLGLERIREAPRRKILLTVSLGANLAILGFFKYYDFFANSLSGLLARCGVPVHLTTLHIILPVGISFYTFQTMSYAIDVYRREVKATSNLVNFLAYVSFFPQLVAGPIERGKHLLPQFSETRVINRAQLQEGIWLCLWGMFKKVVIADSLAPLVEMVYEHPRPGAALIVLGTVAFGLQIYGDFSGYSDIARGTARLLGFDLMLNFNLPYVSTSLREFWQRWHISLSTWLRDYLYVPMGGNRHGPARTYRNLFATMLLGGLWHGAAWNFAAWGAWHGAGLAVQRFWSSWRKDGPTRPNAKGRGVVKPSAGAGKAAFLSCSAPSPRLGIAWAVVPRGDPWPVLSWIITMAFVFYGWLLFRAGSWSRVELLTSGLSDFVSPPWLHSYVIDLLLFALPLIGMELWQYRSKDLLVALRLPSWTQAMLQGVLLMGILIVWEREKVPFIYFQF